MKNALKLFVLGTFLYFVASCAAAFGQCPSAQQTTVSFTITDTDGQVWNGGKVTANLYNPSQTQKPLCATTSQTFPLVQSVTLDSSGHGSFVLTGNTAITPMGTRWIFTLQSNTSALPSISTPQLVQTGGSQNLTSILSAQAQGPRFQAIPGSYGYRASETLPQPCLPANQWLDVLNGITYVCHGGSYVTNSVELQTNGVDNHSQVLYNLKAGAGVTLSNPSGGEVDVVTSGGSSVPLNPTTTDNVFLSFSGLYDDNHQSSPAVAVSTWTCGTGACTVNTSAPHGLTAAKSYVDMTAVTGFGATNQTPFNGSFLVATTPTSTSFTFAYTGSAISGSGGSIYDASFWAIYRTAVQPTFLNHGKLYGVESDLASADTNFSTLIAPLCTAPGPCNLIINAGQNDLNSGASAATIEGHLQSIWAKAHAAGFTVWQGTISGANYGGSPNFNILQDTAAINAWIFGQTINFAASATGQYYDHPIDYANSLSSGALNGYLGSGATPAQNDLFADITNTAFLTLSGQFVTPPIYNYGAGGLLINQGPTGAWFWMNSNKQLYMQLGVTDINGQSGIQIESYTGNNAPPLYIKTNQTNMGAYAVGPATNQVFLWGYNYVGDRNPANNLWLCVYDPNLGCHNQPGGNPYYSVQFFLDSTVGFPGVSPGVALPLIGLDSTGKIVPGTAATPPVLTAATGAFYQTTPATLSGGGSITIYDEDFETGALNDNTPTTVTAPHSITNFMGLVCTADSTNDITGNPRTIAAQWVTGATVTVTANGSASTANCHLRGWN